MSLRTGGETRRWSAIEQAAFRGRSSGEQSEARRRSAHAHGTKSHAPPLPSPLPSPSPSRSPATRWESWSRGVATVAAEPLVLGTAIALGGRPGPPSSPAPSQHPASHSQPAAGRAATLIPGNSNSLRVGLGRKGTPLPTSLPGPGNVRALCFLRLTEGLGLGLGWGEFRGQRGRWGPISPPSALWIPLWTVEVGWGTASPRGRRRHSPPLITSLCRPETPEDSGSGPAMGRRTPRGAGSLFSSRFAFPGHRQCWLSPGACAQERSPCLPCRSARDACRTQACQGGGGSSRRALSASLSRGAST